MSLALRQLIAPMIAAGFFWAAAAPPAWAGDGWRHQSAPPAARYESRPSAKHGHVWVPGYWSWGRGRYVWVGGHWLRHRPGYHYQAPHWVHRNGHYTFNDGRWSRYRDSDGDGVPNRYDRRPRDPSRY